MDQLLTPVPTGPFQISAQSPALLKLSLILPTFNESGNISEIVRILSDLLDPAWAGRYELIVVDDNSPDRTWKIALDLTKQYPQLSGSRRDFRRN
jgi:dolichol-phosphate mannosyltransferase